MRKRLLQHLKLLVLLLGVAVGAACGGQHQGLLEAGPGTPAAAAAPSEGLPAIPSGREASAPVGSSCSGSQTFLRSGNASDSGAALRLSSGADELSWAVWELSAADRKLQQLSFDFSISPGNTVYAAIADY